MKSMQNINMVLGKICVMQLLEVIEDITSLLDTRRWMEFQGGILGQVLFSVFANYLSDMLFITYKLFANDRKIYDKIENNEYKNVLLS